MSKAPKQKKNQLHYQPYQQTNTVDEFDDEVPLQLDPVLAGLSSSMSRNLWDDWNEDSMNMGFKMDDLMTLEDFDPSAPLRIPPVLQPQQQPQQHQQPQQQPIVTSATAQPPAHQSVTPSTAATAASASAGATSNMTGSSSLLPDVLQSFSLETNELFGTPVHGTVQVPKHPVTPAGPSTPSSQQHQHQQQLHQQLQLQLHQQEQQQQQLQHQQHQQHQQSVNMSNEAPLLKRTFSDELTSMLVDDGDEPSSGGLFEVPPSKKQSQSPHHESIQTVGDIFDASQTKQSMQPHLNGMTQKLMNANQQHNLLAINGFEDQDALMKSIDMELMATTSSSAASTPSHVKLNVPKLTTSSSAPNLMKPNGSHVGTSSANTVSSSAPKIPVASGASATAASSSSSTAASRVQQPHQQQAQATSASPLDMFGNQGMMMPGFMMYPNPMMNSYNPMAMMQMQMQMQMNNMANMGSLASNMSNMPNMPNMAGMAAMGMGMQIPQVPMAMGPMGMPMGMPMEMQMSMAGMAANATQMGSNPLAPMPGMPMNPAVVAAAVASSANPFLAPGATPANSSSATTSSSSASASTTPTILPRKEIRPAGGFVSIAKRPEEPEVSSILKQLMDEEAKKKERKLERNRDSARESRRKQQSYVEALEQGIKRLQLNKDMVVRYQWANPSAASLFNEVSHQELVEHLRIVTGATEGFIKLMNPTCFYQLMQVHRQKLALSMGPNQKLQQLAVFVKAIGHVLQHLRTTLLELSVFQSLIASGSSSSSLVQELGQHLQLHTSQREQLHALLINQQQQQVVKQEILRLAVLMKLWSFCQRRLVQLIACGPSLERFFQEVCPAEQLQKLLNWSETNREWIRALE